nr:phosphatidate cytidylyltransferase [Kofleriaceae bacterium]
MSNLLQRFLVAVVAVPILIVILYWPRPEPTWLLIFVASILAMREFFAMTLPKDDRDGAMWMGMLACCAFYWLNPHVAYLRYGDDSTYTELCELAGPTLPITLAVLVPGLYYLFRFRDMQTVAARFAATVAGIIYAGFLFTFLALLKTIDPRNGGDTVILVLAVAWIADTGAYFAGRFLGKTKLYEAVSPKKTWAGAWGGLAGSVLGAAILKVVHFDELTWLDVVLIAVPGGILGQMGDLAESLIKRSVGVKDSGSLLPGHGGMLDRIDAVLFIGPYVYAYLTVVKPHL